MKLETDIKLTGLDFLLRNAGAGLRLAVIALLVFCLFRPTLVLKAAVPQQNFLGVLVDDSRSMSIADVGGQTRSSFIHHQARPNPTAAAVRDRTVLSVSN